MQTVTLFISSPGDLIPERNLCKQVFSELEKRFAAHLKLELFFWEDEPVLATDTFQTQFPRAADSDIFICLLWSRIGTPLPKGAVFADGTPILRADGSEYESGTVAEFEDALGAYQQSKTPAILMYFKRAEIQLDAEDPSFLAKSQQRHAVEQFFNKWFKDEQGRYPRGYSAFKNLTEFAKQLERHLCKLLLSRFLSDSSQHQRLCHSDWQGNPFLGLASYQSQHSRIYFGRDIAINDIYAALQQQARLQQPFVMVLGQSGSGKSSLIQAGVLPLFALLKVPCFIFRPALSVAGDDKSLWQSFRSQLPQQLKANDSTELPHAVAYIDQFEELFTLAQFSHASRRYFFAALDKLVRHGKIWLLASMRSEFLPRLSDYPRLSALLEGQGRYLLLPPTPSEIYRMITEPAESAGLVFEKQPHKKPLNQLIFDAIANQPYSLALLSFTLSELYQQRQDETLLTYSAYERIGGVQGALSGYAEAIYGQLMPKQRQILHGFIRLLVKVDADSGQAYSARATPIEQLAQTPEQQALLQQLLNARLFSSEQTPQAQVIIRVSHEALLNHWTRLHQWLEADREYLLIRERINDAMKLWQQADQHPDLLLPDGKPLLEALALSKQWPEALNHEDAVYIEKSEQAVRAKIEEKAQAAAHKLKRSRQIIALFAVFNILLFISVYIAYQQSTEARQAQHQAELEQQSAKRHAALAEQQKQEAQIQHQIAEQARRKTQRTQALFLADLAKQENQKGDYTLATLLTLEGLPRENTVFSRPLVPELAQQLYQAYSLQRGQAQIEFSSSPLQMAYQPQNHEIAVANLQGRIWRWDQTTQKLNNKPLILNNWGVTRVAYSPDGRYIAASSEDGLLKLWQLQEGTLQSQLILSERINHFTFSPDGEQIAVASGNMDNTEPHSLYLWDWQHKTQQDLIGHQGAILYVDYSADGKRLISAGADNVAIIWSRAFNQQEQSLYAHQAPLSQAFFSPDQKRILTTDSSGVWCLWDSHGRLLTQQAAHSDNISSAAFSPNSQQFVTAGWDGQVYTWESNKGKRLYALRGHKDEVYYVDYSPNGQQILSCSNDQSVRLWSSSTGKIITPLQAHPTRVYQVMFSPDGEQIASIGGQLWQKTGNQLNLWRNQAAQQHIAKGQSTLARMDDRVLLHQAKTGIISIWQTEKRRKLASLETQLSDIALISHSEDTQQLIFIGHNAQQQAEWQRWYGKDNKYRQQDRKTLDVFESLALSADKRTLITGHADGRLQLWRMRNGERKNALQFQEAPIQQIAFAADNEHFAAADKLGNIYYYAADPQERYHVQAQWKIEVPIKQIALEGDWLLALNQTALYRQSLNQTQQQQRLSVPAKQNWHSFALSPEKDKFALLSQGKQAQLHYWHWSNDTLFEKETLIDWNSSAHWAWLDSKRLLNIDAEQTLNIWEASPDDYHLQTWQQIPLNSEHITQIEYANNVLLALDSAGVLHRYPIYQDLARLIDDSSAALLRQLSKAEKQRFFLDDVQMQ